MSLGPVVLHPRSVPVPSVAFGVLAVISIVVALLLDGWMAQVVGAAAVLLALMALWLVFQARRSSVLIDAHQFIVKDGGKQRRFDIDQIANIDLRRYRGYVRFKDGSSVSLPLDGTELTEAGLLLSQTSQDL